MPKKNKAILTKVIPVKMNQETYDRLQKVAEQVGEADSTIIRLVLRAGLTEIERRGYEILSLGEAKKSAPAKIARSGRAVNPRSSTPSTPVSGRYPDLTETGERSPLAAEST